MEGQISTRVYTELDSDMYESMPDGVSTEVPEYFNEGKNIFDKLC